MKTSTLTRNLLMNNRLLFLVLVLACNQSAKAQLSTGKELIKSQPISYLDTTLKGSEKYVLRVDDKPFYMTEIQVRIDKLRYSWDFDANARDAIIERAALDGFNTLTMPLHWYEVETEKGQFNWQILDEYLGLCKKYHVKMELLWFGNNSYGSVVPLGDHVKGHFLRTPDYVLYSPNPRSPNTTSEFNIRRDITNYTLDLTDKKLMERETFVLGQVMNHIAEWDKANGSTHVVVGVQLDNEVRGKDETNQFPDAVVINYLSHLGTAVKQSPYVVWTRINSVDVDARTRVDANYHLRIKGGSNIDFVGIDLYDYRAENMRSPIPSTFASGNYRMICESGAEITKAACFQLAALSGDNAYDHYDLLGPDGHGLYDRSGSTGFKPHGSYISEVRTVNKLINSDLSDIALKSNGKGLFVHNWEGRSIDPTTGVAGIVFIPATATSEAVSIKHDTNNIILMTTLGGRFLLPASLAVKSASRGYYDKRNEWVNEGKAPFSPTSISVPARATIRLVCGKQ